MEPSTEQVLLHSFRDELARLLQECLTITTKGEFHLLADGKEKLRAKIKTVDLGVYAPTGKVVRGYLTDSYDGFDLIDSSGVITNKSRHEDRLAVLSTSVGKITSAVQAASEPRIAATPVPKKERRNLLSIDIDGTIANITKRLALAESQAKKPSAKYWNILLDGKNYPLDEPILEARDFLLSFLQSNSSFDIMYLSSRRNDTVAQTREWLNRYRFPPGEIYHREKNTQTIPFKRDVLRQLGKEGHYLFAHIGDSPDDLEAARQAGVRGIQVPENAWNTAQVIQDLFPESVR